jgi:sec-independent protein translocase protein TatB
VFNIQGSELIFLLLIALLVLGPEKLPDAIRKGTKAYTEFKKMANGFQGELRQVLDEPMRELRDTADAVREAARFDVDLDMGLGTSTGKPPNNPMERATPGVSDVAPKSAPIKREQGLNFGSANARRQQRVARDETVEPATDAADDAAGASTPDTAEPEQDAAE